MVKQLRWLGLISVVVVALTAGAVVLLTGQLASGDPFPTPPPDLTPAPPPPGVQDTLPSPHFIPGTPPPLDINGVMVSIPSGAEYITFGPPLGGDFGPGGPTLGIARGKSVIWWNSDAVMRVEIAPEDQADFQPFLDTLKDALASSARE